MITKFWVGQEKEDSLDSAKEEEQQIYDEGVYNETKVTSTENGESKYYSICQ